MKSKVERAGSGVHTTSSLSEGRRPTIELVSWTQNPIPTAYYLWQRSKMSNFDMSMEQVVERYEAKFHNWEGSFRKEVDELFMKILRQEIPISENIEFVFMLNDDSIAHREQMVRHRIGHNHGDNFGVDIVPEASRSSYWSQSMRILDMSAFADEQRFLVPDSVLANESVHKEYLFVMNLIQDYYAKWTSDNKIPFEDARNIMPLAATMDISWKMSLQALLHVLGKRSCWILQLGLWEPIITGILEELCSKIHPMFREIILPPCFTDGEFTGCVYKHENERRVDGRDKLCVCPLYMKEQDPTLVNCTLLSDDHLTDTVQRAEKYQKLWGRDAWTGEELS